MNLLVQMSSLDDVVSSDYMPKDVPSRDSIEFDSIWHDDDGTVPNDAVLTDDDSNPYNDDAVKDSARHVMNRIHQLHQKLQHVPTLDENR